MSEASRWDGVAPLCLIGMSGVGKSHWARALHDERGFDWHDCDRTIASHLRELVTPDAGEEPVHAVGRWMGMPWSAGYDERERRYLDLEAKVTRSALEDTTGQQAPQVLDTTGSVVYLESGLLSRIHRETFVVYLRTPPSSYERMLERYLEEPKPVVWGGTFRSPEGTPPAQSLPACYRALLADRDQRYQSLAHVVLDADQLEHETVTVDDFLDRLGPTPG